MVYVKVVRALLLRPFFLTKIELNKKRPSLQYDGLEVIRFWCYPKKGYL